MTLFNDWQDIEFPKETISKKNIEVGDYTYYSGSYDNKKFEDHCVRYNYENNSSDRLINGKFCSIANGIQFNIGGSQRHHYEWVSTYPFFYMFSEDNLIIPDPYNKKGDTIVGNDVWIGSDALIMPGVTIGSGAVIGARSVVTKNIEPYTIVAGVPARTIKKRFSPEVIDALLDLAWWDLPVADLKELMPVLASDRVEDVISLGNKLKHSSWGGDI